MTQSVPDTLDIYPPNLREHLQVICLHTGMTPADAMREALWCYEKKLSKNEGSFTEEFAPSRERRGVYHRVPLSSMRWIESRNKQTYIHCDDGVIPSRTTLAQFEKLWRGRVLRIRRTTLVLTHRIRRMETKDGKVSVVLDSGHELPIARRQNARIKRWIKFPGSINK